MATLDQFVGTELGTSDWVLVSQDMINQFAETTGDRQWIHVDVERATRESPFGGPIAPPAYDVLYWNADTTRLPAAFHADLLSIMGESPFTHPGKMQIGGTPLDMRQVKVDAYVVAGVTDHITPWRACYQTARIYGPKSTFVLANAGHLQSILNPPGVAKSYFSSAPAAAADPDAWAASAPRVEGSWWPHWIEWMSSRSGERAAPPGQLGSRKHRPGAAAPGEYIFEP